MSQREYDLCLFGATGFVGRLTAHYLAASAPAGTRIALGGRSRTKLESLQSELGAPAGSWALVVADSFDQAALGDWLALPPPSPPVPVPTPVTAAIWWPPALRPAPTTPT